MNPTSRRVSCPHCRAGLRVANTVTDQSLKCPKCRKGFRVPPDESAAASASAGAAAHARKAGAGENDDGPEVYGVAADADELPLPSKLEAISPEALAKPHACPVCFATMPAGGVLCVRCGYHLLEGKRHRGVREPMSAYAVYRRDTRLRLNNLTQSLSNADCRKPVALRKLLASVAGQLGDCVPPEPLNTGPAALAKSNAKTLTRLARLIPRVIESMRADLALNKWALEAEQAKRHFLERLKLVVDHVRMLERDADVTHQLGIRLDLSTILDADKDPFWDALRLALKKAGVCPAVLLGRRDADARMTRRLDVDVTFFQAVFSATSASQSLTATTQLSCHDDDEEGDNRSKTVTSEVGDLPLSGGDLLDVARATWASNLVQDLPKRFLDAWDAKWEGIALKCPNCGHPRLGTSRTSQYELCLKCGQDAYTGLPEELLLRARDAEDAGFLYGMLAGLAGVLLAGTWIWTLIGWSMNTVLLWILTTVTGAGLLVFIALAMVAGADHRRVLAEQEAARETFQHAEFIEENEQKLQKAGARTVSFDVVDEESA